MTDTGQTSTSPPLPSTAEFGDVPGDITIHSIRPFTTGILVIHIIAFSIQPRLPRVPIFQV